jgi:hypothetical protein
LHNRIPSRGGFLRGFAQADEADHKATHFLARRGTRNARKTLILFLFHFDF